jgi:hypothetical protein
VWLGARVCKADWTEEQFSLVRRRSWIGIDERVSSNDLAGRVLRAVRRHNRCTPRACGSSGRGADGYCGMGRLRDLFRARGVPQLPRKHLGAIDYYLERSAQEGVMSGSPGAGITSSRRNNTDRDPTRVVGDVLRQIRHLNGQHRYLTAWGYSSRRAARG